MANQQQLRKILRAHPEGLTTRQIADILNDDIDNVITRLKKMVDTYIIGWTSERVHAIWAVVVVPENCPRPPKSAETLRKLRYKE